MNIAVEGESDREAAKMVVRSAGHSIGVVSVAGGKTRLDPKIPKYNQAARRVSWVVFRDSDAGCPVVLRQALTAQLSLNPRFALRIAHSMTEAWLLSDRSGFAKFFNVQLSRVPAHPEQLTHAKRSVLDLCAGSRSRAIRTDLVASDGKTGPLYVRRINEFASTLWNVEIAAENSPSLARALSNIRKLPG